MGFRSAKCSLSAAPDNEGEKFFVLVQTLSLHCQSILKIHLKFLNNLGWKFSVKRRLHGVLKVMALRFSSARNQNSNKENLISSSAEKMFRFISASLVDLNLHMKILGSSLSLFAMIIKKYQMYRR
jgi:hypothetical protein